MTGCYKLGKIMNIGVIVFSYNRSRHLKKVIDGLKKNRGVSKLYIFQDGLKCEEHRVEWERVHSVIKEINWCQVEYKLSPYNKGLAKSIVDGVNSVFADNNAVIVLEDDCVPHPQFMEYMTNALKKYEMNKKVYHIGASSEPVDVVPNGTDAYFLGRINSWGWGTWKDRWEQFSNDYKMLGKVKADPELNDWFKLWGQDLESHILGNIYGTTDTWAAFWALTVIIKKGYCMSPYESLINNIGFDGTGVHCGNNESRLKLRKEEKLTPISLPDMPEMVKDYKKVFANYYPWTNPAIRDMYYKNVALDILEFKHKKIRISNWIESKGISTLCIWGKGKLCDCLINELEGKAKVCAIIETMPCGKEYKGIPIIRYIDIPQDVSIIIIIPGYDLDRIKNMVDDDLIRNKLISIDELILQVRGEEADA